MLAVRRIRGTAALVGALGVAAGIVGSAAAGSTSRDAEPGSLADSTIAPFRAELLDLAFRAATAIPAEPHARSRAKAQEAVVSSCLELDQLGRASGYLEAIDGWRRGVANADLALRVARCDAAADVQPYLDRAIRIAEDAGDWQRDRVRVHVAMAYAWLGQDAKVAELLALVAESEAGKVAAVRAQRLDASALSTALADLEAVFASGNFDRVKDALDTASELYRRFCDDPDRRDSVARAFEASSAKVPPGLRLEVLGNFAEAALDHGDRGEALARARDAQRVLEGVRWAPEELIPLEARLAGILHGAGETAEAKRNLARALDTFERERYRIVDIERAGVLRAVGEAYASTGDGSSARAVYAKAVDEGVVNPNSKPRAEDLSATCRSMAVSQVEPGAELAARLHQILASLGEPW